MNPFTPSLNLCASLTCSLVFVNLLDKNTREEFLSNLCKQIGVLPFSFFFCGKFQTPAVWSTRQPCLPSPSIQRRPPPYFAACLDLISLRLELNCRSWTPARTVDVSWWMWVGVVAVSLQFKDGPRLIFLRQKGGGGCSGLPRVPVKFGVCCSDAGRCSSRRRRLTVNTWQPMVWIFEDNACY